MSISFTRDVVEVIFTLFTIVTCLGKFCRSFRIPELCIMFASIYIETHTHNTHRMEYCYKEQGTNEKKNTQEPIIWQADVVCLIFGI